jgi:HD-GYP domain-containing protein (c-di-GMP phosphodiesterase class II)
VHTGGTELQDEVQLVLGRGDNGDAEPSEVRESAVQALIYGHERWDGHGYPEGRKGTAIPRVARALAVCRRFEAIMSWSDWAEQLRLRSAKELDPRMVQRFAAMMRARRSAQN